MPTDSHTLIAVSFLIVGLFFVFLGVGSCFEHKNIKVSKIDDKNGRVLSFFVGVFLFIFGIYFFAKNCGFFVDVGLDNTDINIEGSTTFSKDGDSCYISNEKINFSLKNIQDVQLFCHTDNRINEGTDSCSFSFPYNDKIIDRTAKKYNILIKFFKKMPGTPNEKISGVFEKDFLICNSKIHKEHPKYKYGG